MPFLTQHCSGLIMHLIVRDEDKEIGGNPKHGKQKATKLDINFA